jgi:hypothetical protein
VAAPEGPIERRKGTRGARVTSASTASRPSGVANGVQKICSECGEPFIAATDAAKTCCEAHRKRRERRKKRQGTAFTDYDVDVSATALAMEKATSAAVADLPNVARELIRDELRPAVREALSGQVLESIGDMLGLMPLVQAALKDDLTALTPVWNDEGNQLLDTHGEPALVPDYDRRAKAVALMLKYTVGQPGLAPQPDAPEAAGVTVVFSGMPEPTIVSTADELPEERLAELESGESRQCDICNEVKARDLFIGASSRCEECQGKLRVRVDEAVAAMEARTP